MVIFQGLYLDFNFINYFTVLHNQYFSYIQRRQLETKTIADSGTLLEDSGYYNPPLIINAF